MKYADIEVGLDFEPEPGLADNGDLEYDLQALIEAAGEAAKSAGTALAIFIDELQYVEKEQLAALDESFLRVRFDRLTPTEKTDLRAMAELGPGPHRSGDIAQAVGRPVTSLAPTRSALIAKGMIWSPSHGDTAFTVPLFDGFMRRTVPGEDWRQ